MSDTRMLLFTGKGGVGKSTTSACTAVHHAAQGLRTILVSTDPAHSTDDVVDVAVGVGDPVRLSDNLWAQNLDTTSEARVFMDRLNAYLSDGLGAIKDFDPELFTEAASFPGMDEYFALEKILGLLEGTEVCPEDGRPYDVVVFDTAPTGHTLRALATPEHLKRFILRLMRMRKFIANLKGAFLFKRREVDPVQAALDDIIARSDRFMTHLRDTDRVGIYLVSIPTEAGFSECARTVGWLGSSINIPVAGLVVNQIVPDVGSAHWSQTDNPAVALLKAEFDMQQPYLDRYQALASETGTHLVGVHRMPFEPKGIDRLASFARRVWSPDTGLRAPPGTQS